MYGQKTGEKKKSTQKKSKNKQSKKHTQNTPEFLTPLRRARFASASSISSETMPKRLQKPSVYTKNVMQASPAVQRKGSKGSTV